MHRNLIKLISGIVSVSLVCTVVVAFWVWEVKKQDAQNKKDEQENLVEFVKASENANAQIYRGSKIGFDSDIMGLVNNWNPNGTTYKCDFFTNRQISIEWATKFGITTTTLSDGMEGWKAGNTTKEIEFITTSRKADAEYAVWLKYRDYSGEQWVEPNRFIPDEGAMRKVQEFTNYTIIPMLKHANKNLTIDYKLAGVDRVVSGGTEYILAKVFENTIYYDNIEITWRYSMRVNATGAVIWVDGPTDFQLSADTKAYLGTPVDLMNFYMKNGIEVNNTSNIYGVVIYGLKVVYGPVQSTNSITFAPLYYIDYRVLHTDGSMERHRNCLLIKGVSAP